MAKHTMYCGEPLLREGVYYMVIDDGLIDELATTPIMDFISEDAFGNMAPGVQMGFMGKTLTALPEKVQQGIDEGWIWKADSAEALAEACGMENLADTLEAYNRYCATGVDEEMFKEAQFLRAVGTGSLVETLQLAHALDNKGLLTAVDSTAQGIALIRKAFAELQDETDTTLRAVNAPASVFLPRLNANDYDLIVVAGDAENYAATFAQASRLLRVHGVIVFTDVLALEDGQGGVINPADRSDKAIAMRELLTTVEDDEGFESTLTPDGTGLLIAYKK